MLTYAKGEKVIIKCKHLFTAHIIIIAPSSSLNNRATRNTSHHRRRKKKIIHFVPVRVSFFPSCAENVPGV